MRPTPALQDVRAGLVEIMEPSELVAATEAMELDDMADFVADLPEAVTNQVLRSLSQRDRERLSAVLSYPEDSAGGLMNPDTISVRPDVTLEVVIRYLRMLGEMPDKTDAIFVVDRNDHYLGSLFVSRLLTRDPDGSRTSSTSTSRTRTPRSRARSRTTSSS